MNRWFFFAIMLVWLVIGWATMLMGKDSEFPALMLLLSAGIWSILQKLEQSA